MAPSKTSKTKTQFLVLNLLITYVSSATTDLTSLVYKGCANQKFQDPSGISQLNLKQLYTTLITQSSTTNYYNTTSGNTQLTTTSVTGFFQCRGDLSNNDCNTCVKRIPGVIQKVCGGDTIAARVQLVGCSMLYEIVGFPPTSPTDVLFKNCGSGKASGSGFDSRLESALGEVVKGVGGGGKGFYANAYESVYVLAQCEGDLGSGDCVNCVKSGVESVRSACGSSLSGQVYLEKCYVSYTYYPNGVPGSGTGGGGGIQTGARFAKSTANRISGIVQVMVKARIQDRDGDLYSPVETLGLRYLIQFAAEKETAVPDDHTKVRRICISSLKMAVTPLEKGSGQIKNHKIKDVEHVVQRPRAVLSSPDNDHLIGEMNKKALKRGSTQNTRPSGRVNVTRVGVDSARIRPLT
ncbi:gnk2-like domain-containing protein [Artemisia annua]|uniref:Gnk2-like domain-containing protein n=1 Tax=Artemisia annua TaxID=35608 RepID=A0A2U1MYN7_ARTAN|nr:gnk2-like domain-containing protein [Artemisia annua]